VEELVARGYDRVADAYAALEGEERWPRDAWVERLLGRLPERALVLDVGCGSGLPVLRTIVDQGHEAVGVDISSEQLRRARVNVPEAKLVRATARSLELAPASFDAVVALYVTDHLPRETLPTLFASLRTSLRPGGWLLATFETGDEPGAVGTWLGEPMFFSSYEPETTLRLVREATFDVVESAIERQREGARAVEYLWILARTRPQPTPKPEPPGDPLWFPPCGQRSQRRRTRG
jgi:cyclopropane fatty-acyl-phospholipid synthase-like methyltransferase